MVSLSRKIFHKKTLAIFTLCSWHDFLGGISLKWAPKENHNLIWQESIRYNLMLRAPHHENPIKININENIKHSKPNKTNSRNALRDPLFTFTYIAKKKQATTSSQRKGAFVLAFLKTIDSTMSFFWVLDDFDSYFQIWLQKLALDVVQIFITNKKYISNPKFILYSNYLFIAGLKTSTMIKSVNI